MWCICLLSSALGIVVFKLGIGVFKLGIVVFKLGIIEFVRLRTFGFMPHNAFMRHNPDTLNGSH